MTSTKPKQEYLSSPAQILLVSLSFKSWHDEMYSRLLNIMLGRAEIKRVKTRNAALGFLDNNSPQAVIVTDEGIANPSNAAVLKALVKYAGNGGTVVLGMLFSSMINEDAMNGTFAEFGLSWKRGCYERSTFALNQSAVDGLVGLKLVRSYSQKALRVARVEPRNALYLATSDSVVESMVFAPTPVDQNEAPIAWIKIGEGYLGYIGDVNAEEETDAVIMAMCRISN